MMKADTGKKNAPAVKTTESLKLKKGGSEKKLIQSIERAADILYLFLDEKDYLGIAEIAKAVSLPKPTVQGIVNTLVAREYLERDPFAGRYRLGRMLFQLGMTYAAKLDIVSITRGWTERLCFQFNQPVNCGMLVGKKVVVVLRVEPANQFMVFPQLGNTINAHSTCIGKMILAFMPEQNRNEFLEAYSFVAMTANTITDRKRFDEELLAVQQTGISFDNEENVRGLAGIGGPIRNYTGQVVAAFAITGDARQIFEKRDEIINAIRYTSANISSQLGYKPKS